MKVLFYRPRNRSDDVVLALTTTGTVKVWTLTGEEGTGGGNNEPILENESKQIRCLGAVSLTCCVYNMRTVGNVSTKIFEITKDMIQNLFSEIC